MTTVLLILAAVLMVSVFGSLYWWTRRSERDMDLERPGLSDEQSNALRFGIAVGINQGNTGI
jgi:nitrogen fixation-related uncharacterized protein